jgi:hypothetical protein
MVWLYERHSNYIRCETREATDDALELIILQLDGKEIVERHEDSGSLARRQQQLESSFRGDGWTGPFGRTI